MKKLIRLAFSIMLIVAIAAGYSRITYILSNKIGYSQKYDYVNDKAPVDVVFLGTSQIKYSVSPMLLWRSYGITSYNLGVESSFVDLYKPILQNALTYHRPQIAVIDVDKIVLTKENIAAKKEMGDTVACKAFDGFPMTGTKIRSVCEYTDDQQERADILLHFPEYHDRWKELKKEDFVYPAAYDKLKGYKPFFDTKPVGAPVRVVPTDTVIRRGYDYEYIKDLRILIDYCRKENIQPVLVKIPFNANRDEQEQMNMVYKVAREKDVPYINMIHKGVINPLTDYNDDGDHLNFGGGTKVTEYIGSYLNCHYKLTDHREDGACGSWRQASDEYCQNMIQHLRSSTGSVESYMMILSDRMFRCEIRCSDSGLIYDNRKLREFYDQIWDPKMVTDRSIGSGMIRIKAYRIDTGQLVNEAGFTVHKINDSRKVRMRKWMS